MFYSVGYKSGPGLWRGPCGLVAVFDVLPDGGFYGSRHIRDGVKPFQDVGVRVSVKLQRKADDGFPLIRFDGFFLCGCHGASPYR